MTAQIANQFDNEEAGWQPGDDEPSVDFWTDFDWEQLCMIQLEEMELWNALDEDVKKKGEAFMVEM